MSNVRGTMVSPNPPPNTNPPARNPAHQLCPISDCKPGVPADRLVLKAVDSMIGNDDGWNGGRLT